VNCLYFNCSYNGLSFFTGIENGIFYYILMYTAIFYFISSDTVEFVVNASFYFTDIMSSKQVSIRLCMIPFHLVNNVVRIYVWPQTSVYSLSLNLFDLVTNVTGHDSKMGGCSVHVGIFDVVMLTTISPPVRNETKSNNCKGLSTRGNN